MQGGLGARMEKASTSIMTNRAYLSPTLCSNAFSDTLSSLRFTDYITFSQTQRPLSSTPCRLIFPTLHQMIDWEFVRS